MQSFKRQIFLLHLLHKKQLSPIFSVQTIFLYFGGKYFHFVELILLGLTTIYLHVTCFCCYFLLLRFGELSMIFTDFPLRKGEAFSFFHPPPFTTHADASHHWDTLVYPDYIRIRIHRVHYGGRVIIFSQPAMKYTMSISFSVLFYFVFLRVLLVFGLLLSFLSTYHVFIPKLFLKLCDSPLKSVFSNISLTRRHLC